MRCPKCGLTNPDIASRCDCGWNFKTNKSDFSYARPTDRRIDAERGLTLEQVGVRNIKIGVCVLLGGLVLAVVVSQATTIVSNGALAVIPYGGITGGIVLLFKGLGQRKRGRAELR